MQEIQENIKDINGFNVHYIPNQKYKTLTVVLKLRAPLDRDTITKRALLPYVLKQGTKQYPSKQELQIKLDGLYGASLSIDGAKKGENHIISVRLDIANQKFLAGDSSVFEEGLQLLYDVLFNPNVDDQGFNKSIFSREKETLKQKNLSLKDDKMSYANLRLIDEMCKGEPYAVHVHGYLDDLETITPASLFSYYQQVVANDQIDIYVQGDLSKENMEEAIKKVFQQANKNQPRLKHKDLKERHFNKTDVTPKEIVETDKVQQAKLHIGYRTNVTFGEPAYYALHVLNGIFGGFPSSKLFINVREKNSLAYYAASRMESHKGLLFVFSGIAPEDFEKARDIIKKQVEAMKQGDFTTQDIAEAKAVITNQLLETFDSPQGTIEFLYQQVLANKKITPLHFVEQLNKVTKEEIVAVAKRLQEDTTYLLTAEKGDSHE
ncbi:MULTISPECIES: pitrilysin family protein [Virgibacillus]|uniref:EF-P 5-aminopentanol modification-associated protein YfmF n=1 Tax=Virgibacillus TaxID=84406 RepID=UPI00098AECEA|nr:MULTISPECIES: pitrilysin family protein [Virgibacillus]NWO14650.1 insulinase family protein [Virgibacillus sp.]